MRHLSFIFLLFLSGSIFGQQQSVAVIVEEHSERFDFIFYCKVALLIVIAIVALSTYIKYHKQENSAE